MTSAANQTDTASARGDRTSTPAPVSLRKLFFSTFFLSCFTFGGGYVIITLMKQKLVDQYHWLSETEMLDLTAIAQAAPGPVAVNGALLTGFRLAGIRGAAVCVLGSVLPPLGILSILSFFYGAFRTNPHIAALLWGMKAGVCAVIFSTVWDMGKGIGKTRDPVCILTLVSGFILSCFFRVNIIVLFLAALLLGTLRAIFSAHRG